MYPVSDSNWTGLTVRHGGRGTGIISIFKKNQYTGLYSQSSQLHDSSVCKYTFTVVYRPLILCDILTDSQTIAKYQGPSMEGDQEA